MISYVIVLGGSLLVGATLAAQSIFFNDPLYWYASSFYAIFATLAIYH